MDLARCLWRDRGRARCCPGDRTGSVCGIAVRRAVPGASGSSGNGADGWVAENGLARHLDRRFWADSSDHGPATFQIFRPLPTVELSGGYPAREERGQADWVESTAEYRQSMDSDRPTLITVPARQVLARMREQTSDN